ncbi:MAG: type II toxin-antitoxin system CcdA family antitoxin [Sphingomonas sp.]|uniref:type II toxin-antitoxin system CcdA family antitoxin n=1 Tax=Sphingomonas sp. TaxID=28214 RepID=UPI0018588971|nr:type II toxin-antitoxin system CcdA family antitoxin [Sphingomonas sp.]MBA3666877.1 type II toxin-antitoxin system CcdA family antitoxin [Sphingomonas sp.]
MRMMNIQRSLRRRGTNVSLDAALVDEAKTLGISLSQSCEQGLAAAVKSERERRWLEENRPAIEAYNAYIRDHGVPLARFRQF